MKQRSRTSGREKKTRTCSTRVHRFFLSPLSPLSSPSPFSWPVVATGARLVCIVSENSSLRSHSRSPRPTVTLCAVVRAGRRRLVIPQTPCGRLNLSSEDSGLMASRFLYQPAKFLCTNMCNAQRDTKLARHILALSQVRTRSIAVSRSRSCDHAGLSSIFSHARAARYTAPRSCPKQTTRSSSGFPPRADNPHSAEHWSDAISARPL
jgi:hypothetical protein